MNLRKLGLCGVLLGALATGCDEGKMHHGNKVIAEQTKREEVSKDSNYLEGIVKEEIYGYPEIEGSKNNLEMNVPYVLKVDTEKGLYVMEVKSWRFDDKSIPALAAAIDKGDKIRFAISWNRSQGWGGDKVYYFSEDRIGYCKSGDITLLEKGKQGVSGPAEAVEKK